MTMVKVKVSELVGPALDWAVAQADSVEVKVLLKDNPEERWPTQYAGYPGGPYWPSTDWSQGGPLIEKYQVRFDHRRIDCGKVIASADGMMYDHGIPGCDSYLVAACRAIVAAKIGDTVSVPAELVEGV